MGIIAYSNALYSTTPVTKTKSNYSFDLLEIAPSTRKESLGLISRPEVLLNKLLKLSVEPVLEILARYSSEKVGLYFASGNSVWSGYNIYKEEVSSEFFTAKDVCTLTPSMLAGKVAYILSCNHQVVTDASACASSLRMFNEANKDLLLGLVDAAVIVSVDNANSEDLHEFFINRGIIGNDSPFKLGEGASIHVLTNDCSESSIGNLLGVSWVTEIHKDYTAMNPNGLGYIKALRNVLSQSGLDSSNVDWIKMHDTGTVVNNQFESSAVDSVLGNIKRFGVKQLIGHTLGASFGVELDYIIKTMSLHNTTGILTSAGMGNVFGAAAIEFLQ